MASVDSFHRPYRALEGSCSDIARLARMATVIDSVYQGNTDQGFYFFLCARLDHGNLLETVTVRVGSRPYVSTR